MAFIRMEMNVLLVIVAVKNVLDQQKPYVLFGTLTQNLILIGLLHGKKNNFLFNYNFFIFLIVIGTEFIKMETNVHLVFQDAKNVVVQLKNIVH